MGEVGWHLAWIVGSIGGKAGKMDWDQIMKSLKAQLMNTSQGEPSRDFQQSVEWLDLFLKADLNISLHWRQEANLKAVRPGVRWWMVNVMY